MLPIAGLRIQEAVEAPEGEVGLLEAQPMAQHHMTTQEKSEHRLSLRFVPRMKHDLLCGTFCFEIAGHEVELVYIIRIWWVKERLILSVFHFFVQSHVRRMRLDERNNNKIKT